MAGASSYLDDLRGTVEALAASQGIAHADMEQKLRAYPESVGQFLVLAFEAAGAAAFDGAFRLVDCLENLGCRHLRVANPSRQDAVEVFLHRSNGTPATVRMGRDALSLDRYQMIRVLKQQLGLLEDTIMVAPVRPRGAPAPARSPKDAEAEELLRESGQSADELLGLDDAGGPGATPKP